MGEKTVLACGLRNRFRRVSLLPEYRWRDIGRPLCEPVGRRWLSRSMMTLLLVNGLRHYVRLVRRGQYVGCIGVFMGGVLEMLRMPVTIG